VGREIIEIGKVGREKWEGKRWEGKLVGKQQQ
jgi:hypothetical protein